MKPFDRRLLRYAKSVRAVFLGGALLGLVKTCAVITWCWCISAATAVLVLPMLDSSGSGAGLIATDAPAHDQLPALIAGAFASICVRASASWGIDQLAARGSVRAKFEIRNAALQSLDLRSPEWFAGRSDTDLATVLGRGLDALDGYFSAYLPQLILTVCATPLLIFAVFLADPVSALTVVIVFPVIPLFMVLIGLATRSVQERQWGQLERLSRSFLDVVEGLSTLKIFRREDRQIERITAEANDYRTRTMQVLKVTFLSGFVLDLAGTFSIALVAVTIGTRLVTGEFSLTLGLFVLLLLPEAFMPIRAVGAAFHASAEGLSAAGRAFEIIEQSPVWPVQVSEVAPDRPAATGRPLHEQVDHEQLEHDPRALLHLIASPVAVVHDVSLVVTEASFERTGATAVGPISFSVRTGEYVALAGPSGVGKSTLVSSILGFLSPTHGSVEHTGLVSWVGQRPSLLQGTVAENIALGADQIDIALVRRSLHTVGLVGIEPEQALGVFGAGLSGGQAQRVAIARCLYRAWSLDTPLIVCDEPSSALDERTEALIADALQAEARQGRAVLVVSHRSGLLEKADRIVEMGQPI